MKELRKGLLWSVCNTAKTILVNTFELVGHGDPFASVESNQKPKTNTQIDY